MFNHLRDWLISFHLPFWNYKIATKGASIKKWRQTRTSTSTGGGQSADNEEAILSDFASYETGSGTITRDILLKAIGDEEEL